MISIKKRKSKALAFAMALIMSFGIITPMMTQKASAEDDEPEYVTINVGDTVTYGTYSTHYMTQTTLEDDGHSRYVYCTQPSLPTPASGKYKIDKIYEGGGDTGLRKVLYYMPGSYGYTKVTKARWFTDGGEWENNSKKRYALAHVILSWWRDGYSESSDAFLGCYDEYKTKAREIIKDIDNLPDPPASYRAFWVKVAGCQDMVGGYYAPEGKVKIQKVSSLPKHTDGNSCYSFKGAEFTVYNEKGKEVDVLVADEDGETPESKELTAGTYTVKETKVPEGFSEEAVKDVVKTVEIKEGETATVEFPNVPQGDPVGVLIQKLDKDTGKADPQGNGTLKDAEFTVTFYKGFFTKSELEGRKDDGQWVLKTDKDGYAYFSEEYLVSGDEFYRNPNGTPTIPLGTVTIKETKAPEGYLPDPETYIDHVESEGNLTFISTLNKLVDKDAVKEPVERGGVMIDKRDAETDDTPQGNASFDDTAFEIINKSKNAVEVDGVEYEPNEVCKRIQMENGVAQTSNDCLPFGDYKIVEVKAPTGYLNQGKIEADFSIEYDKQMVDLRGAIQNPVERGGVLINKRDEQTGATPQGNATFEGTEFSIYNKSKNPVKVDGTVYAPGEVCKKIYIKDGVAQTTNKCLPFGDYTIVETKAPEGYLNKGKIQENFSITKDGQMVDLREKIENPVIRGGVQIQKWDKELDKSEAVGGANKSENADGAKLTGIEFTITNISRNPVVVEGKTYKPDEVITTLTTAWNEEVKAYTVQTPSDYLPYGRYTIQETKTNDSYLLTDGKAKQFDIIEEGKIVTAGIDGKDLVFKNQVKRGDIELEKIANATSERMNVPFVIENLTTGEKHVIVSDENGEASTATSWNPHSNNTNANDKLLEMETITAKDMDVMAGVWFSKGEFGSDAPVNDELGALPYGKYKITEMQCEGNKDYTMQSWYFKIYRDGRVVDLGTVTNDRITIGTTAVDKETGEHIAIAKKNVTIVDTVDYSGAKPGEEYTMNGILMNKETGLPLEIDGKQITATKTFKARTEHGSVKMEFTFDASSLKNIDVVVFESMAQGDLIVATHEDLDSEEQTVTFLNPSLVTTAIDDKTQSHMSYPSKKASITDTILYDGLLADETYTITGTLYDKETKRPVKVDGKEVSQTMEFTAEGSGELKMNFKFDATGFEGKTIVVFEEIFYNGKSFVQHNDIEDTQQTICFPSVATQAKDKATGKNIIKPAKKTVIVDTVEYRNLMPDEITFEALDMPEGMMTVIEEVSKAEEAGTPMTDEQIEALIMKHMTEEEINAWLESFSAEDFEALLEAVDSQYFHLEGVLMDKETGKPVKIDGKEVRAETMFIPDGADGTIKLEFPEIDGTKVDGKSLVVFEYLYYKGELVGQHADIKDKAQTVTITATPQTGQALPFALGGLLVAGLAAVYALRTRKELQ